MHHNYWACAREPRNCNYWAMCWTTEASTPRACTLRQEKPLQWEAQAMQLESSPLLAATREKPTQQQRPSTATHTQKRSHMPQVKAKTKPKKKSSSLPPTTGTHCLWCLVTSSRVSLCKIKCNLIPSVLSTQSITQCSQWRIFLFSLNPVTPQIFSYQSISTSSFFLLW